MPEKEYIEKDKALNAIECIDISDCTDIDDIFTEAERAIDDLPTADVAEVKHGEWKIVDSDLGWVDGKCSACGYTDCFYESGFYKFCPECGAKMDGKENGNAVHRQ